MPKSGWKAAAKLSITDTTAMLGFTHGDLTMTAIITAKGDVRTIHIVLSRSLE